MLRIFAAALCVIAVGGCIDEIKLPIRDTQPQLVVDGLIADSMAVYTIRLYYSAEIGVGTDNVHEPVTGATVEVYDDAGEVFVFAEFGAGVYQCEMQGQTGRAYHVRIRTQAGREIRSHPAVIPRAPEIDSVTAEVKEEGYLNPEGNLIVENRLVLKMHTHYDGFDRKPSLRWRIDGEYEFKEAPSPNVKICYVKNRVDLNNLRILDAGSLQGTTIGDEVLLNTELDYRFAYQYCFHVTQYAIPDDEYDYWKAVNELINIDGSLFDPPPGNVRGNLYDVGDEQVEVAGYFSVNGSHYVRYFANPQSLQQIYIEPRCAAGRFRPQYAGCADCTTLNESTLERPEYWEP